MNSALTRSASTPLRVFVTHNPEDLDAYYGRALPRLAQIAEVVQNPTERDLSTAELIDAAAECDVIVAHRSTPGDAAVFEQLPRLVAFLRCAVDIEHDRRRCSLGRRRTDRSGRQDLRASTAEMALGLMLDVARNITNPRSSMQSAACRHSDRAYSCEGGRPASSDTGQSALISPICCVASGWRCWSTIRSSPTPSDGFELVAVRGIARGAPTSCSRWLPALPTPRT